MSTKRTAPWRYTGDKDGNGQPLAFYTGVPARDLTQEDIDALSADDYALVRAGVIYANDAKDDAKADPKTDTKAGKE